MSSTGIFMDVRIMMVVMMLALGTGGIAMAATVTSNLKHLISIRPVKS